MNKTKINRRKSKTRNRNKTKKIKGGGGFLASFSSMFTPNKVSEDFKNLLKCKNVSEDLQKVYDAKNKDNATFNTAVTSLKDNLKKLNELIPKIESEYNKSTSGNIELTTKMTSTNPGLNPNPNPPQI
jgi:hypothetical protein